MTFDEFRKVTSTIEAFYEKALNPTQAELWFSELKGYTAARYEEVLKKLCATSQYRPSLNVILENMRNHKVEVQSEVVDCPACKGTGLMIYKKKINGISYDYVYQCPCANGARVAYDGRKCKDPKLRSDYYLATAEEVFYGKEGTEYEKTT